jgi:hypothetical protein
MGVGKIIWKTLADFGSHTTIGGLCNAGLASSRPRQIYWLIIFFVMFGYTIKLLVDNVSQYLEYNVITSTDLSYSSSLYFPAVTICNQNRLVLQRFKAFTLLNNCQYRFKADIMSNEYKWTPIQSLSTIHNIQSGIRWTNPKVKKQLFAVT